MYWKKPKQEIKYVKCLTSYANSVDKEFYSFKKKFFINLKKNVNIFKEKMLPDILILVLSCSMLN